VIPGFGVAGVLGILALGAGLFLSFLGSYPSPSEIWRVVTTILTSFALAAVGGVVMLMLLPTAPIWSRLSLKTRLEKPPEPARSIDLSPASHLLGASGVTVTPLLPSGIGLFQGKRLDIISEGEYIPAETRVTIIHVEGNRLVVRPESIDQPDLGASN
jgi:membrane-bound serine protease (ClpP class)